MQAFNSATLKGKPYHALFIQKGGSLEMDRYIYNMHGEGLGSFFGSLLRKTLPLATSAIKAAVKTAKPHAVAAGREIVSAGAKQGVNHLKRLIDSSHINHKPHKKRRRTRIKKWRNL